MTANDQLEEQLKHHPTASSKPLERAIVARSSKGTVSCGLPALDAGNRAQCFWALFASKYWSFCAAQHSNCCDDRLA